MQVGDGEHLVTILCVVCVGFGLGLELGDVLVFLGRRTLGVEAGGVLVMLASKENGEGWWTFTSATGGSTDLP